MNNFRYPTNTLGPSRINLVSASALPSKRARVKVVLLIASAVIVLMALSSLGILLLLPKRHVEYFNATEGRVDWTTRPVTDWPLLATSNKPEEPEMSDDLKTLYQEMELNMNMTMDPCDDFYEYACGMFPGRHPVLENQREVSYFSLEYDKIRNRTIEVLEGDSLNRMSSSFQYLKRVWDTCVLDYSADPTPLMEYLEELDKLESWEEKFARVTKDGFNVLLTVKTESDPRMSYSVTLSIDRPELEHGNAFVTVSHWYPAAMYYSDLIRLSKNNVSEAATYFELALEMMEFEHWLSTNATAESERIKRPWDFLKFGRTAPNPDALNKMTGMDWNPILETLLDKTRPDVVIRDPEYLRKFKAIVDSKNESFISDYIKMSVFRQSCFALGGECRQIQRNFLRQIDPSRLVDFDRQTCFDTISRQLEDLLIVAYSFDWPTGDRWLANGIFQRILHQFKTDVHNFWWMDEETRLEAMRILERVNTFAEFKWPKWMEFSVERKYGKLHLGSNKHEDFLSYFLNLTRQMKQEEIQMLSSRIVDIPPWHIPLFSRTPSTSALRKEISVPMLVLQGHFFNESFPIEIKYGILGSMIGHAMTHTIDHQADKYLSAQKLDFWTEETREAFDERMACLTDAYDKEEVVINGRPYDMNINGSSTLDENLADWMGLVAAYEAYKNVTLDASPGAPKTEYPYELNKYSQDQMFFLSYAQTQCSSDSQQVLLDAFLGTHSPRKFRVNGPLKQMDEFAEAFDCDWGSNMNPRKKCVYH